ncbi:MAG TPA: homocitrate synthase [Lachnospiraceae bacterium]|nr:homocitrate synthase [Lachnospiraceae bacterium]
MKEKRHIIDTTLRDGEQGPGIALGVEQKIMIAKLLDELGVYEIEAGIPCLGKTEIESLERIVDSATNSKISVWSRMNKEDVKYSIACKPDIIHIGVPVSYVQIYNKFRKNKAWVQKMILECVEVALKHRTEVTVGFEDASRADVGFLVTLAMTLKKEGVNTIRLADTVGVLMVQKTREIVESIVSNVDIDIEIHAHNDLGMAVANSIEGVKAGAKYVDCTLFGLGERAGNCNMYDFIYATDSLYDYGIQKEKVRKIENAVKDMFYCVG